MTSTWHSIQLKELLRYHEELVELNDMTEYVTITVKRRHGGLEEREKFFGHQIKTKKQYRLKPGTFIISRIQCWHEAYAIVPEKIPSNMIASLNYDQFIIQPKIDPRFFWWLSYSPLFIKTIRDSAYGVVIEKMVFNRDSWLERSIPIPELSEQKRIVARIEEIVRRIESARVLRRQAEEKLEVLVNTIARRMLSAVNDEVSELQSLLDDKDSGIQTGPFGVQLSSSDFTDSGVPILTIGNIQDNGLRLQNLRYVSNEKARQLSRFTVKEGDILFARMGTVGRCCVIPKEAEGWLFNYHLIRVTLDKSRVDPGYAKWFIRASTDVENYLSKKIRGATRQGVNSKILSSLPFRIPSLSRQRDIVTYLDGLQTKEGDIKNLQKWTANRFDDFVPLILDKAFRGEL